MEIIFEWSRVSFSTPKGPRNENASDFSLARGYFNITFYSALTPATLG
jgi:hypothetical protein